MERTRRTLITCALALFHEKGVHFTKVEDITERADVGKGTFYRHFQTKEELIQEILVEGFEMLLAQAEEAIKAGEMGKPLMQEVIRAQTDFYLRHPEYLLFFHQIQGLLQMKSQAVKELRQVFDGYLERLALIVRPALGDAARPASSARHFAMAVSSFVSGLLVHHLLFDKEGGEDHRETLQAQLERSIQALM